MRTSDAEDEITCECLPFVGVKSDVPEATLDVEIQFNHGDRPPFIVHVTNETPASVERAFEAAAFMGEYRLIGRTDETDRYKVVPAVGMESQLGDQIEDLPGLRALASADFVMKRIRVTQSGWIQTGWFDDRATLDEFREFWQHN